jgi:HK97 gp10 family phage protein
MAGVGSNFKVLGVEETQRALKGLSDSSQRRVVRPAVRAGASMLSKAAKRNAAPTNFDDSLGGLRRSIGVKVKTNRNKAGVHAVVGARLGQGEKADPRVKGGVRKPFYYSHLVEKGTKPHAVGKRQHLGAKPKPFLEPALESNKSAINAAIRTRLAQEIEKEAARQAAKAVRGGA